MTTAHRRLIAAALAAVLLIVGGFVVARLTSPSEEAVPGSTSAEAGFARDMQVHHAQAVEMSMSVYRTSDNAEIRALAYDIATGQAQQAGQMYGWLEAWGLSQASPEPAMTWMVRPALDGTMDHSSGTAGTDGTEMVPGGAMPGYATAEQMGELDAATAIERDRLYLELMIEHHLGGVEMADAVLVRTVRPEVVSLATGVVKAQTAEVETMRNLLATL